MKKDCSKTRRPSSYSLRVGLPLSLIAVLLFSLGASDPSGSPSDLEELSQASAERREELRRKRDRFEKLSPAEQDRLRAFHLELIGHENSAELVEVLSLYSEWLRTLTPVQRAEIQDLELEARIERIKEIKGEEARRALGFFGETKLPEADIQRIQDWVDQFVVSHEEAIIELFPSRFRRDLDESRSEDHRRRRLAFAVTGLELEDLQGLVGNSEAESFFNMLSDEAKEILLNRESSEERVILVQRWIRFALISRTFPQIAEEELQRFFNEDLTEEERDELDRMHPDQRERRLIWMYRSRQPNGWSRGGRRPDGDHRGDGERGDGGRGDRNRGDGDRGDGDQEDDVRNDDDPGGRERSDDEGRDGDECRNRRGADSPG